MSKIYRGQTAGRVVATTGVDFTIYPPVDMKIKFVKPDGTTGEWNAAILGGYEDKGKLYVDFSSGVNFDMAGTWTLWAYVIFNDGRGAPGAKFRYVVAIEGN